MKNKEEPMEQPIQQPVYTFPPKAPQPVFATGKGELAFALWTFVFALCAVNGLFYGGGALLFGLSLLALLGGTAFYLRRRGHRFGWYENTLLVLCGALAAGFFISSDSYMPALAFLILLTVPALAFCIAAGQSRRSPAGVLSLLDSPRATFALGIGNLGSTARGFREAFRRSGRIGRTTSAIGIGLLISLPVLAVMIAELVSADAAFEGLLDLLPEFELDESITTAVLGFALTVVLYARGVALHRMPKSDTPAKAPRSFNALTINTILFAVCGLYLVYLASQLAYVVGGFSGILPEDFTLAEYARRGFFEMSRLCALNLTIMALGVGLTRKEGRSPLLTRILALFIGLMTLFFVAAASAKMIMYIRSYGLTWSRVTTEVFMLWLAVTTVLVSVWLFKASLPYMKLSMVVGLALCAALFLADVDAQVARYNVRAYQSGKLETVDVSYLEELSVGAVPYLEELTQDADEEVAKKALSALEDYDEWRIPYGSDSDWRHWNLSTSRSAEILEKYQEAAEAN